LLLIMFRSRIVFLFLLLTSAYPRSHAISLKTTSRIKGRSRAEVFSFLSTPSNWPKIVLSSWSVDGAAVDKPLKQRDTVKESFGLPPLLPLYVDWECTKSDPKSGLLDVKSPGGVGGLASDCRMLFQVGEHHYDGGERSSAATVCLTMEYEPRNILAKLAVPVLVMDNFIALNILLPYALRQEQQSRLDKFRALMGMLYGTAGLLHFSDCLLGSSQLFTKFGWPSFYELPNEGQLLALFWCAMGPIAYMLSFVGLGDIGLVSYGLVEVSLTTLANEQFAFAAEETNTAWGLDPVANAVLVQAIILASWIYSFLDPKAKGDIESN
jgi:hypothetical protein